MCFYPPFSRIVRNRQNERAKDQLRDGLVSDSPTEQSTPPNVASGLPAGTIPGSLPGSGTAFSVDGLLGLPRQVTGMPLGVVTNLTETTDINSNKRKLPVDGEYIIQAWDFSVF